jgi:signal transduction histidine kinase/CheY-like chemotaxis protein
MNNGDTGKTKEQLIAELDELREKMVRLVSLSELETIFKILPDTYFRMDEQGTILDYKAGQFSDLIDNPGQLLGRKIGEILPVDAAGKIMNAMKEARKIQALNVVEYSLAVPGGLQYYEARLLPFEHHQFLSVIRNITERKKTEEEIKQHREHLQAMVEVRTLELEIINQQLKAEIAERENAEEELKSAKEVAESASGLKSRFLANMSHDIRTPLSSILGFANLILKGNIDDISRKYVGKIINSGDGLLNLLNDILDFSKIEAGQLEVYPQTFLAEELVENIKSLFYLQFEQNGIEFQIKKHPRVPDRLYGDKWRMHQVLTNLLSNSLKFTKKGTVTVEIDYIKTTDRLRFWVKDTGIGIAKKNREDIFKPFTRLQSFKEFEKTGTGIGLAICKNLVNLMGGNIHVKSRLNQGSLFTFDIPAHSKKAREEPLTVNITGEIITDLEKKSGNRILIVDDNPVNQELIREQLRSVGFNSLVLANNGQEAIEQTVKHQPDLILMDIQMPVMDGNEAIGKLRQKGCKIPIIALSAFAMREYINKSLDAGADEYITRPVDFERFFSQISPFLKEKKGGLEPGPITTTANHENKKEGTIIKQSISNRVRKVFLEDAQKKLGMLTRALDTGNFKQSKKELKVIAHNYKGNAGFFGLTYLENAAQQLDQALNNKETDETLIALAQNMTDILKQIIETNYIEI